jgi:hypothetical protein
MGYFFESLYLPEDSSQEFAQNGCPERAAAAIVQSITWTTRRPQRGQTDANRREPRIVQKSSVRLRGDGCKPGIAYPRRIQHPIEPMVRIELCGYAPQNAPKACYNLLVKWTKQPSERPESKGEWGAASVSRSPSQTQKFPRRSKHFQLAACETAAVVHNGGCGGIRTIPATARLYMGFSLPLAGSACRLPDLGRA